MTWHALSMQIYAGLSSFESVIWTSLPRLLSSSSKYVLQPSSCWFTPLTDIFFPLWSMGDTSLCTWLLPSCTANNLTFITILNLMCRKKWSSLSIEQTIFTAWICTIGWAHHYAIKHNHFNRCCTRNNQSISLFVRFCAFRTYISLDKSITPLLPRAS